MTCLTQDTCLRQILCASFLSVVFCRTCNINNYLLEIFKSQEKCQKFDKWKSLTSYVGEQWETEVEDEQVVNFLKCHGLIQRTCSDVLLVICPSPLVTPVWLRKERVPQSLLMPSLPLPLLQLLPGKHRDFNSKSCCASKHLTLEDGVRFQTWCRFFSCWTGFIYPLRSILMVFFHCFCFGRLLSTILEYSLIDIQVIDDRRM